MWLRLRVQTVLQSPALEWWNSRNRVGTVGTEEDQADIHIPERTPSADLCYCEPFTQNYVVIGCNRLWIWSYLWWIILSIHKIKLEWWVPSLKAQFKWHCWHYSMPWPQWLGPTVSSSPSSETRPPVDGGGGNMLLKIAKKNTKILKIGVFSRLMAFKSGQRNLNWQAFIFPSFFCLKQESFNFSLLFFRCNILPLVQGGGGGLQPWHDR